jgi:hypothetical protein
MTLTVSSTTLAQETPALNECNARVAACEQVINAAQKYITVLNNQVEKQDALIVQLERDLALANREIETIKPAWYEKAGFIIPATIVGTAAAILLVRKASQ